MISEEQLTKWEHQIDIGTLNCYQVVPKLVAEVRKLEKEADWLADKLARFDTCPNEMLKDDVDCFLRCKRHMYTKPCWRAFATEAVKNV